MQDFSPFFLQRRFRFYVPPNVTLLYPSGGPAESPTSVLVQVPRKHTHALARAFKFAHSESTRATLCRLRWLMLFARSDAPDVAVPHCRAKNDLLHRILTSSKAV